MKYAVQNCMTEWSFSSGKPYGDPFGEVEVDVVFTEPGGEEKRMPAFWAGGQTWKVRYATPVVGTHRYRTECCDTGNADLHGQEGEGEVAPYEGDNPLLKHGPLRVSADQRHFEHIDGTPFLWLGDTWWMGLCKRLRWPGDFQLLVADRVAKGFSVIQIVAGPYPDMGPFDPRGVNEAGHSWTEGFDCVNPAYFDMADMRMNHLVESGLVPCILGCWGYYIDFAGVEVMKKHWRYLLARYGAYPVVWCMAGEATMLYYLSPARGDKDAQAEAAAKARQDWTEVARYLRSIDPHHHMVTLHPSQSARDTVDDQSVLDFDMLQTGHGGRDSLPNTVNRLNASLAATPKMPGMVGEVCYEGIGGHSWEDVQRFAFWACMLSGAAGHTYGANGIWQINTQEEPYGPSPHGMTWGDRPWQEAYRLPGSGQLGIAKRLFERYRWWEFEPRPEWVEPHASEDNCFLPYAAGIPGVVRVFYSPRPRADLKVTGIEDGARYHAFWLDPRTGKEYDLGIVEPNEQHTWSPPGRAPLFQDMVLVMENAAP